MKAGGGGGEMMAIDYWRGVDSHRSPMPGSGIGGVSRSNLQVFERMSALFPSFPSESLQCLRLFVDTNEDQWFFMRAGKDKGAWTLLEQGMKSPDDGIREAAEEIVHLLGSKGYLEYRELLGKSRAAGRAIEENADVQAGKKDSEAEG